MKECNPARSPKPGTSEQTQPKFAILEYRLGSNLELENKIRGGSVVIGRLRLYSHFTTGLAFVGGPTLPCDVVVNSLENRKQALHGDIVAVELLGGVEDWPGVDVDDGCSEGPDDNNKNGGVDGKETMREKLPDGRNITRWVKDTSRPNESTAEYRWAKKLSAPLSYDWGGKKPFGVVSAVLERRSSLFVVARLCEDALAPNEPVRSDRYYQFKSFNPLLPHIAVYGRDIPTHVGDSLGTSFFVLRLVTQKNGNFFWTSRRFLTGKIENVIGGVDSIRANSFALCNALGVSMDDFSEESYACVPEVFNVPSNEELLRMNRRDLREEEFVCSIDPSTARDLDDALSITSTSGGYRVGVHIADVSYFVPAGSALDEEARGRSTSVYLVEKVIPMLPRKLSEDYCSLNPGSDKFAFSCIVHLDSHGKITSEWFGRSVIRNRCRLSYEEAQRILDDDPTVLDTLDFGDANDVEKLKGRVRVSVRTLFELASKLRTASLNRGRLAIGNTKLLCLFEDTENQGLPYGFGTSRQTEANWLVEEFMLLANARVAEKIVEFMPDQALLRRHEPADRKKVSAFKQSLSHIGLQLQDNSSGSLMALLEEAKNSEFYFDLCTAFKYLLPSAEYFANGAEDTHAYRGHYALALPWYTHFTSPIRRYCDIIVHRQLLCALEIESIVKAAAAANKGKNNNNNNNNNNSSNSFSTPPFGGSIELSQLSTRQYFYSLSEVEEIVDNANIKKVSARQASDASLSVFFCQYLKALRRVLEKSSNLQTPFTPRVQAVVVRTRESQQCFTLFSKEVALEAQISLLSKNQRFKHEGGESDSKDDGNTEKTDTTNKSNNTNKKEEKQHKNMRKKGKTDTSKGLIINWGLHPVTGEKVEEEVVLLSVCTAVLTIRKNKGYEEIDMIIDPPWERSNDIPPLPRTLLCE